jgi:hypothetical protein
VTEGEKQKSTHPYLTQATTPQKKKKKIIEVKYIYEKKIKNYMP